MFDAYTEGTWKGQPNYECTACPRADLDENRMQQVQLKDCPKADCPGKPKAKVTRTRTSPILGPNNKPLNVEEPTTPPDVTPFFPNKEATTHG